MTSRSPQNKRKTGTEQYYTPFQEAERLTKVMLEFAPRDCTWLEPAGGRGAFVDAMLANGVKDVVSYDIEPKHGKVSLTGDFLKEDLSHLTNCVTLSNPPFGRANKLSVPFFNKCAAVSNWIGFIIPKSWRKWSVMNRLDTSFHLAYDEDLAIDYEYEGASPDKKGRLSTVFQIWERKDFPRMIVEIPDYGYIEKTTPQEADVSLTAFGRGCGTTKTDFPRVPNTTQMFLKLKQPWVLEGLRQVDFKRFSTNVAFTEALSIQEINYLLHEYHQNQQHT
jgi:predicted RNA methylase